MYLLYVRVPNLVLKIFTSTKSFPVKFENMWGKISIIFNEQLLILRIVNYMHSNKFILWRILIKLSKIFISIIYFILQKKKKKWYRNTNSISKYLNSEDCQTYHLFEKVHIKGTFLEKLRHGIIWSKSHVGELQEIFSTRLFVGQYFFFIFDFQLC